MNSDKYLFLRSHTEREISCFRAPLLFLCRLSCRPFEGSAAFVLWSARHPFLSFRWHAAFGWLHVLGPVRGWKVGGERCCECRDFDGAGESPTSRREMKRLSSFGMGPGSTSGRERNADTTGLGGGIPWNRGTHFAGLRSNLTVFPVFRHCLPFRSGSARSYHRTYGLTFESRTPFHPTSPRLVHNTSTVSVQTFTAEGCGRPLTTPSRRGGRGDGDPGKCGAPRATAACNRITAVRVSETPQPTG